MPKTVAVTGTATGMGRATVNKFGAEGVPANGMNFDIDGGFSTALATGQLDFSGGM